ncbi:putative quinol monooxygenase [Streptomyces sp. GbtcB7]|uniref:putative quinol monooxygenase n=1 Tax=Streptomyces sp. GbtcB7 TaxID=2824752 RepID=UPI001C30F8E8|nr:putative quinol monooxygenase [Streptomyces sp. GbtcB7]
MFTVIVSLQVRPEKTDRFLAAIRANSRATRRDEPGCLRFDVHRSTDDPQRFLLYELYRDEKAFREEHRAAPHYPAWRAAAAECVVDGGHVNTFFVPSFPEDIPESSAVEAL